MSLDKYLATRCGGIESSAPSATASSSMDEAFIRSGTPAGLADPADEDEKVDGDEELEEDEDEDELVALADE